MSNLYDLTKWMVRRILYGELLTCLLSKTEHNILVWQKVNRNNYEVKDGDLLFYLQGFPWNRKLRCNLWAEESKTNRTVLSYRTLGVNRLWKMLQKREEKGDKKRHKENQCINKEILKQYLKGC